MAFPLPKLLPRIEELLQEVQWLDGLILITDSDRACFVSFSQVDPLLRRLRQRPKGPEVAEKLCILAGLPWQGGCKARPGLSGGWQFLARNDWSQRQQSASPSRHRAPPPLPGFGGLTGHWAESEPR
mgnify:CR=1 FL=1